MTHLSAAAWVQHLLFLFLLVVAPAWDLHYTRRLKRDPSSARKVGVYKTQCAWQWIAAAVAVFAVGFRPIFTITLAPGGDAWLDLAWVHWLLVAVIALFALGVVLPYAVVLWKKVKARPRKYASAEALKPMMWFLPATANERRWFALASVTAGICEELLFRGFLLRYLHIVPWRLPLTAALVVAAVIFALQHLYQGAVGSAVTGVIGLLLSLLFLLTGNLLAPMVLHAVTDLRMLVILPAPGKASAAAG